MTIFAFMPKGKFIPILPLCIEGKFYAKAVVVYITTAFCITGFGHGYFYKVTPFMHKGKIAWHKIIPFTHFAFVHNYANAVIEYTTTAFYANKKNSL